MKVMAGAIIGLVAMVAIVTAYPSGAPDTACLAMIPNHPNTTTSGTPPYKIKLSTTAYKPGSTISGSISSPNMNKFRGFLIQARAPMAKNASLPVGQFENPTKDSHTVCGVNDLQGLTHNNNTDKTSVTFSWKAPAAYSGDLVFHLTVVESFDPSRYWLSIMSDKVLDCSLHASSANCAKLTRKRKNKKVGKKRGMALRFHSLKRKNTPTK